MNDALSKVGTLAGKGFDRAKPSRSSVDVLEGAAPLCLGEAIAKPGSAPGPYGRRLVGIRICMAASALLLIGSVCQADLADEMRQARSRVQAMGHGYYSDADWVDVFGELDRIAKVAEETDRLELAVEAGLLKAMVYTDMRKDYVGSLDILDDLREKYAARAPSNIKNVYVRQAEVYAKLGDEMAIRDLIREFKASPHLDAQRYEFSGGQGRDVPLSVVRPHGQGSGSLTVTAMERYRNAAKFAPGNPCPTFDTVDREGVSLRLEDYRGQVVLLDFWLGHWAPWQRELPHLSKVYRQYHPYGFEVVGILLDRKPDALNNLRISQHAVWRHVVGDLKLPAKFQVYGEAANFLVDQEGVIIGRDLKGSDLVQAIQKALGME